MRKRKLNKLAANEKGQTLIIVLILLLLGGLIIAPMLTYMGSGINIGKEVYEERMELFYAADSGVEDGLWQIKYENLGDLITGYNEYNYSTSTDPQYYYYPGYPDSLVVNDKDVGVYVENIWIPKDIAKPSAAEAQQIIEGVGGEPPKLIITGSIPGESTYQIKIFYYYDDDVDPGGAGLMVNTIGIWLPPGFGYAGNCSLQGEVSYSEHVYDYCSGKAVEWDFASVPLVDFAGSTGYPIERNFTFDFTGPAGQSPGTALSWIDTSGMEGDGIDYTWDADTKVYRITSTAKDDAFDPPKQTQVEAYTARSEMRALGSAISGDYVAIGATLMTATGGGTAAYYRDRLYKESNADIQCSNPDAPGYIPISANVDAAYLYWSGWIEGAEDATSPFSDDCGNIYEFWDPGTRWTNVGWWDMEYRGQGSSGSEASRTLSMYISNNPPFYSLDLSPYSGQEVTVSWEQREEQTGWWPPQELEAGDCLKFAFSGDGGLHWSEPYFVAFCDDNPSNSFSYTIPDEYITSQFQIKFILDFDESNEYCYIDDITISASSGSSVEDAKVNRVIFTGDENGSNPITTNQWQTAPNPESGAPDSWSYSCVKDVTDIVSAELADDMSGTFTVGHADVGAGGEYSLYPTGSTDYPLATPAACTSWGCDRYQWTYAGWSLLIIYSSPETKGHQLYLFDTFRYMAPHTEGLKFSISGFLAPDDTSGSHLTYFVGDGDDHYTGDFIAVNPPEGLDGPEVPDTYKLPRPGDPYEPTPPINDRNNVFDSESNTIAEATFKSGIDIDTFDMSERIEPGATSAEVMISNSSSNPWDAELIDLVYIILSFRSDVTSGGTISYLVKG